MVTIKCKVCGEVITKAVSCKIPEDAICKKCQQTIEDGNIIFIETFDGETGTNPKRTGRMVILNEAAVHKMLVYYGKVNYIEQELFEYCFSGMLFL